MKHILTIIAALLLVPLAARCADADTKTLRVFISAGQSNMEGHARIETFALMGHAFAEATPGMMKQQKRP